MPSHVMIVDDGSTDDSAAVAQRHGVEVKVLPHQGVIETYRAGIEAVQTPYHLILNADDELMPDYVKRTRALMIDPEVGVVYTGVQHFGEVEGEEAAIPFSLKLLLFYNFIHGASLVRTSAYHRVGGYDAAFDDYHEDWALWMALISQGWRAAGVEDPLLRYRHVSGSRNPPGLGGIQRTRWRLARRHPRLYGLSGMAKLLAATMRHSVLAKPSGR